MIGVMRVQRVGSLLRMIVSLKTVAVKRQENVNSLVEEGKSGIDSDSDQDDNTSLLYGVEMADPLCIKLNDLIRRGKIDRIPNPLQIFKRRSRNLLQSFARIRQRCYRVFQHNYLPRREEGCMFY